MKSSPPFILIVIATMLAGCYGDGTPSTLTVPIETTPAQASTDTPPLPSPSAAALPTRTAGSVITITSAPTVIHTNTPRATVPPVPSVPPTPNYTAPAGLYGKLFLYFVDQYLLLDFDTGELKEIKITGCSILLPDSTYVLCEKTKGGYYLQDVITGNKKKEFLIPDSCQFGWSADGKYLYFGADGCRFGESVNIIQYEDGSKPLLVSAIVFGDWEWMPPAFSAKGEHFVGIANNTILDWMPLKPETLFAPHLLLTGDLAWAPMSQKFLFGATTREQEIRPQPNRLYIYNYETEESVEMATLAQGFYQIQYPWQPWSDDEKNIAVSTGSDLCVIDIGLKQQKCLRVAKEGFALSTFSWSLDGRFIALILIELGSGRCDLSAFDLQTENIEHLLTLENCSELSGLFWR